MRRLLALFLVRLIGHCYTVYTRCLHCGDWGINLPREVRCGNCGSLNTILYWPMPKGFKQ